MTDNEDFKKDNWMLKMGVTDDEKKKFRPTVLSRIIKIKEIVQNCDVCTFFSGQLF